MLNTKFRVVREMVFDNYFMNEDTIALAYSDKKKGEYFLDTGANPLVFRKKSRIDKYKNFWLKPTFWSENPGDAI